MQYFTFSYNIYICTRVYCEWGQRLSNISSLISDTGSIIMSNTNIQQNLTIKLGQLNILIFYSIILQYYLAIIEFHFQVTVIE